ncbi:MAG: penicillin acylase family protein [Cyclobacteriaceae bacterium]|nr:penicillin acylase family protein [Cyclobacteriaceae bacterium]
MKILKISIISILIIVLAILIGGYTYLQTIKPTYSGTLELQGLNEKTEIFFDDFGVPHIYAENEEGAYFALGYVHAQERLFQMEIISRLASGTLSEILGNKLIETDKLFRTLNLEGKANELVSKTQNNDEPYAKAANAYFKGINSFVVTGSTPIEFTILGIPKREYSIKDSYLTAGVLSFGFAEGFRIDPIVAKIENELGANYLKDLALHYTNGNEKIPTQSTTLTSETIATLHQAINAIPVALWNGSNGWVIDSSKTANGSALFENDTHMGFSQPSVWYEAHLEYPNHSFYGNHAAMIPFGILGRNRFGTWGMTMFENDDVDFFQEKINPQNENEYKNGDHWKSFVIREEVIKVKGKEDILFKIRETKRGPIINDVNTTISSITNDPVSVWWAFREVKKNILKTFYTMDHHSSIEEMRSAVSNIEAPGLNVMYANTNNNIAWWAAAKLPIRPDSINSKTINIGYNGNPYLGNYRFEQNPQSENPKQGYVYSANNQPDTIAGILYPGYYVPEDRAQRIVDLIEAKNDWTVEDMKAMTADHTSPNHPKIAKEIARVISSNIGNNETLKILSQWEGTHEKENIAPTIYYALLSQIIHDAIADELGDTTYTEFGTSHLMKRSYLPLIHNDSSLWWDDIHTEEVEIRTFIFQKAFEKSMSTLKKAYGDDITQWHWGKAHTLEHPHALGRVKPLDKLFNVGTFSVKGGIEVIDNLMFSLSTNGHFKTTGGPAVRTIIDVSDLEHSFTIIPTGQSGNLMSPHYDDQAELFVENKFRKTTMNREEIEKSCKDKLILKPSL